MNTSIDWTRINNDGNGNPRYVCHYNELLTDIEKGSVISSFEDRYKLALKRAHKIGGRKFHNKQYGGGIVFQSYNLHKTESAIKNLLPK